MTSRIFPTAQDAEAAFYEALGRGDLEAMMQVWADDDDIVCVHPTGPRLAGQEAVRASWARMFAAGGTRLEVTQQSVIGGMMFAVHSVLEAAAGARGAQTPAPIVATNVYLRTSAGWRMIVHHASPAPGAPPAAAPREVPKTLH